MAKTYPDIGTFSSGDILTAVTMNDVGTNLDNFRIPSIFIGSFAQSANDATNTDLTLTEISDTDTMFTSGTTVTINTTGIYMVTCYGSWSGGTAPTRADVWATHSADGQIDRDIRVMSSVENNRIAFLYKMTAAQTFKFSVFQDNAANTARTFTGQCAIAWVGQIS